MAFSTEYIYRILDQYSGPLNKISRSTQKFQGMADRAAKRVGKLSSRLEKAGGAMANFRTMIGGAAITAGMFGFAQSASTMEDAMADVGRVTGLTGSALDKMQNQLQTIGRRTGRSAEGLAAIAYEGGKLAIANENMAEFVLMVTKTGAAFDMADSEAGRAVGSIRAKLGLTVGSVNTLMQRINFLADNTSAAGAAMINIVERTSGTFKTLNIPPEVTAGWAAFANQVEVTPELAASGLNQMMGRMMQMPGMLDKMLKDPKNAVVNFLKRFEAMPEARRGVAVLKTFGLEAGRFVLKAVANTKLLDEAMTKAGAAEALGSMDREFANILARSSTAGKRIKETFIDISRAIGNVFLGVFDKYSDRLIRASQYVLAFVKAHPGLVKIAAVFGGILIAITAVAIPLGLMFSMIAGGLPIVAAIGTAIGLISWPVIIAAAGISALIALMAGMWTQSAQLRQSVSNLADAFSPLIDGVKKAVIWIGSKLGISLEGSGAQFESWGDIVAVIIDGIAATIAGLFKLIGGLGGALGALSVGDFSGAWDALKKGVGLEKVDFGSEWSSIKESVGLGGAQSKAAGRAAQNNRVEITGQIGVSASNGAKVERADINLNTGYNMAVAH